jgi:hypothetical protein
VRERLASQITPFPECLIDIFVAGLFCASFILAGLIPRRSAALRHRRKKELPVRVSAERVRGRRGYRGFLGGDPR